MPNFAPIAYLLLFEMGLGGMLDALLPFPSIWIWLPLILFGAAGLILHYRQADLLEAIVFGAPGFFLTMLRPWRWSKSIREKLDIADDETLLAGLQFWWGWKQAEWQERRKERRNRKKNRP